MTASIHAPYAGCRVAFLTQHGKEHLVRDVLEAALGCRLVHTDGFDTDRLGTFTREIAREGSQRDAARKKAAIGMSLTGTSVAIASEGAFGPDPFGGFVPWNTELLLWVDRERSLEISGLAHGPAQHRQRTVATLAELEGFAAEAGFPDHHLVLWPDEPGHPGLCKGLRDPRQLADSFQRAITCSANGKVVVENDLRAFANPTRQKLIREAAADLVRKLASACPACRSPGFWVASQIPGLPCEACGSPTRLPTAEVWQCPACPHQDIRALNLGSLADPGRCDACNP